MNGIDESTRYVTLELHNTQLERIEALIERNLARQEAIAANMRADIGELKGEIKAVHARIDCLEKKVDTSIDGVEKTLNARIDGLEKKIDARIDDLEKKVDVRIDGVVKTLTAHVDGLDKKLDSRVDGLEDSIALTNMRLDDIKSQQSNTLARWGIIIAVGVCVVQVITSVVLQFIH